jgi:hypothetical protein
MRFVTLCEVPIDTDLREGVTQGINNKDGSNQHGKELICKTSSVLHEFVEVDKGANQEEAGNPNANPRVEYEKVNVQLFCNIEQDTRKGKDRTGTSVDHLLVKNISSVRPVKKNRRSVGYISQHICDLPRAVLRSMRTQYHTMLSR